MKKEKVTRPKQRRKKEGQIVLPSIQPLNPDRKPIDNRYQRAEKRVGGTQMDGMAWAFM
jgi:hypothetical protein